MKLNEIIENVIFPMINIDNLPEKAKPLIKTLLTIEKRAVKNYDIIMKVSIKREDLIEKLLKHNFIYDNPPDLEILMDDYVNGFPKTLSQKRENMFNAAKKKNMEVFSFSTLTRPKIAEIKKIPAMNKLILQILKIDKRLEKANDIYEKANESWHKKVEQIEKQGVMLDYNFGDVLA